MKNLATKTFVNEFTEQFSGDHSYDTTRRQTPGMLYCAVQPTAVSNPSLIAWNTSFARELGINTPDDQDIRVLSGNLVSESMIPYAACYAGHQFGNWAGQLGDGRAITLGEWPMPEGNSWELQLKGAGPTPYSRRADGRAVLRSSVREYLMSEAMHYLGVPTTRALSLIDTGDPVMRDMFYDGRAAYEPGAIVMRAAPSFLRFGSFEMLAARKDYDQLKQLADWTIARYYPHITTGYLDWFREIVERTAHMIVEWLRVGFVHGVMNTDNMSVLGLTIDYGPFSFLDAYDPAFSPNTTDHPGKRYAFGKQHEIAYWNLGCLANALLPLFPDTAPLVEAVESFGDVFYEKFYAMKAGKMGLDLVGPEEMKLIDQFENMLATLQPDMTIFYQLLITLPLSPLSPEDTAAHFEKAFYHPVLTDGQLLLSDCIMVYQQRKQRNTIDIEASTANMKANNPRFILRNYMLYQAIQDLENGDYSRFRKLENALQTPYSNDHDEFFEKRPEWANEQPGSATLSCSS